MNTDIMKEYDDRNNMTYWKDDSREYWYKYDENNREIYYKSFYTIFLEEGPNGSEHWYKYDKNNNCIEITKQEFNEIEFRKKEKEYLSRTKCSRFELMEI